MNLKTQNFKSSIIVYSYRCIKAALLPNPSMSWVTEPSKDIRNPKFSEKFRIGIPKQLLLTKTLQVNIWCLQDSLEECYVSILLRYLWKKKL